MYVYRYAKDDQLYTTGFYGSEGDWYPDQDCDTKEEAAARVAYLNGGGKAAPADVDGPFKTAFAALRQAGDQAMHAALERATSQELRERLACAALEGLLAGYPVPDDTINEKQLARNVVVIAEAVAAEIESRRKGG